MHAHISMRAPCPHIVLHRFKKSSAEKIMKAVLEEKLAFTNQRDKKGSAAASLELPWSPPIGHGVCLIQATRVVLRCG